jgi:hypothetical protein
MYVCASLVEKGLMFIGFSMGNINILPPLDQLLSHIRLGVGIRSIRCVLVPPPCGSCMFMLIDNIHHMLCNE